MYPSSIAKYQIIAKIKHLNIIKTAGKLIRPTFLNDVNFGLDDSFCNHADLADSWTKTKMPEVMMECFQASLT